MDGIYFKDIDSSNENEVKKVKIKPEQMKFIETVDECLEEAKTYKEWHPVAIYCGDDIIGFAMYGCFGPNRDTWIDRIMIDRKHQGKGYGKAAMASLIGIVSREYGVDTIYLSIVNGNTSAFNLYKSIGFESINEWDKNGEEIFQYKVSK